jgi:hypothetical protein
MKMIMNTQYLSVIIIGKLKKIMKVIKGVFVLIFLIMVMIGLSLRDKFDKLKNKIWKKTSF